MSILDDRLALTILEVAKLLSCSRSQVEREIQRGRLKTIRVGARRRVTAESIRQVFREGAK